MEETITEPPDYHPGARQFDRNLFDMEKTRSEVGPSVLPSDAVVDSLAQEWTDKDADSGREDLGGERGRGGGAELLWSKNAPGSSISIPSMTGGFTLQPHHSIETADSESLSSYDRDSIHSTSTAGGGTPGPNTPQSHHRRQPTFATQRERLYRAGPGRYVALEDVEPVQSDDIPLRRGMEVEVVFIGKGGYWEGRAGGRQGWFPARAIQEITDDNDSGVFSEYSMKSALPMASLPEYPPAVSSSIQQQQPQQADWSTAGRRDMDVGAVTNVTGAGRVNTVQQPELSSNTQLHQSIPTEQYHVREVVMKCGPRGFGFAMRGVKATKAVKFTPTPQVPALQYIGNVESGGSADLAGLRTGDFLLEINYHNVTYCTHDDVVNIIRQGGKTLQLKVITPVLDHTLRTSVQLQQQVEVVNTTNSLDRQDLMRRDKLPVSLPANSKPPPLSEGSSHMTLLQRETVIDDVPRQPTKGQESPSLERINQSGWDSSQDEAGNTPGTPNHTQKFSYLQPGMSLPLMRQHSPPKKPKTQSPSQSGMMPVSSAKNEPVQTVSTSTAADKSYTLPPQKSYPPLTGVPDSADEEEEEESEFTKALRKGKEKLVNSPAIRKRSSTMPSRPRNTVQRGHFASREQSNSPFTSARSSTEKTAPAIKQPLAAAIMRKIDSIQIGDDRDRSSDEEDSFSKTPPMRIKSHSQSVRKEKAAPAPKPKPQVRRANTVVDPSSMTDANTPSESCKGKIEDISIHHGMQLIRGSSGDVPIHSKREREDKEQGEQSGRMDWKSMLRPVKRTESGRASPDPYDRNRSRSNSNQSPRKGQLGSGYDTTDNRTQFGVESDHLPPPLPAISNRLSMEILNLPPPDNFVSIPGVETGETSTDDIISHDIIPPPLHDRSSRVSPSPPPPPPPDSSPPREPFDHTKFAGVKFTERNKTGFMAPPTNDEEVPSPLPSPMNPSSFDSDVAEPEAILPPQEFVPDREEYGNKGFEILTPPGFEVPTPPVTTNHAGDKMEPDLDDAIRQLQLLSEDLTTRPAGDSKVTSPSGQYLHDASLTRPDTLAPNVSPEQMTIADSPAYTPPVRSRSSTSSSNVSSLPREPEPWPPEITTKTQTHAPVAAGYRVKLMLEWEVEDVCQWLEEIGLGEHCPQFRENEILGEHLLELTKEELAELGVKKIGHKKTFLTKVKELIPSS